MWQPTPVFLPGESHGQRSLAGYSSRSCTESDMTEMTKHNSLKKKANKSQPLKDKTLVRFLKVTSGMRIHVGNVASLDMIYKKVKRHST